MTDRLKRSEEEEEPRYDFAYNEATPVLSADSENRIKKHREKQLTLVEKDVPFSHFNQDNRVNAL